MLSVESSPAADTSANGEARSTGVGPAFGAKRAIWIVFVFIVRTLCLAAALGTALQLFELVRFQKLQPRALGTSAALGSVAMLVAGAYAYRMTRRSFAVEASDEFKRTLGLCAVTWRTIALAVLAGVALCMLNVFCLMHFPPPPAEKFTALVAASAEAGWPRCWWTFYVVCVTPVTEEFVFRGVLFAGLLRSTSLAFAACMTPLVFMLLHVWGLTIYPPALALILLLGAAAQLARILSASLLPSIVVHLSYNLGCAILVHA